jgi:hypothetical protein
MSPGRRLRARRPVPAPRLIDHGDLGVDVELPVPKFGGQPEDAPITLMRLGPRDLESGFQAIAEGARPDAIVTGVSERRQVTTRARRLAHQHGVPWFCDPLLFRAALPGYRTAGHLQELDYMPGRDADPYEPEEFDDLDLLRRTARAVVGAQVDVGSTGAWSASFVISGMRDPWLPVDRVLLQASSAAASAMHVPVLLAGVPLRLMGFSGLEAQRLLVRSLVTHHPDAYVLMLDGVTEESSPERVVAALRLALLLQASGVPVILGRAGDLRSLFWAFGVRGAEFGLGRLLRFYVPDYRRVTRGPGPTPGARVEFPELRSSLPLEKAMRAVASGRLDDCSCPSCADSGGRPVVLERAAEHDAHIVLQEARALAGRSPVERVGDLDRGLGDAARRWRKVTMSGVELGPPDRLEIRRRALDRAVQEGLLEPARIASELRLFEP